MPKYTVTTQFSFLVDTDEADPVDKEYIDFSNAEIVAKFYGGRDALQDLFALTSEPMVSARAATIEEVELVEKRNASFRAFLEHTAKNWDKK